MLEAMQEIREFIPTIYKIVKGVHHECHQIFNSDLRFSFLVYHEGHIQWVWNQLLEKSLYPSSLGLSLKSVHVNKSVSKYNRR